MKYPSLSTKVRLPTEESVSVICSTEGVVCSAKRDLAELLDQATS